MTGLQWGATEQFLNKALSGIIRQCFGKITMAAFCRLRSGVGRENDYIPGSSELVKKQFQWFKQDSIVWI